MTTDSPAFEGVADRRSYRDRRRRFHAANVYEVNGEKLSILDLLRRFNDDEFRRGEISRLADMHLKVGQPARYRLDSELVELEGGEPLTNDCLKALIYPLLRQDQIEVLEQDVADDVDAAYHFDDANLNFRINVFHDRDGLAAVIRSLPRSVPDPHTLGFPNPKVVEDILNLRQGLVIVSGITGSGKSTTIASLLQKLNSSQRLRVITLEDPVEYVMTPELCLISQRELGHDTATFQQGLRSALREDPDVIFVGEIRDTETASLAISAAETGHLVMTTLHTRDSAGVISRLVDLFPAERSREVMSQLSFSLAYVIAQKLVPRKDGLGRAATFEVLKNISAISNLIRTGNWHQIYATMQLQTKEGMMTMERHLTELVKEGVISREMAVRYANDASQLQFDSAKRPVLR